MRNCQGNDFYFPADSSSFLVSLGIQHPHKCFLGRNQVKRRKPKARENHHTYSSLHFLLSLSFVARQLRYQRWILLTQMLTTSSLIKYEFHSIIVTRTHFPAFPEHVKLRISILNSSPVSRIFKESNSGIQQQVKLLQKGCKVSTNAQEMVQ